MEDWVLILAVALAFVCGVALTLALLPKTRPLDSLRDYNRSPLWNNFESRTYRASIDDEDLTEEEAKELFEGMDEEIEKAFDHANTIFKRARTIHRRKRESRRSS